MLNIAATFFTPVRTHGAPRSTHETAPMPEHARGLMTLLLTAAIAALAVIADQLATTWADDQLFVAWIAMWSVVFGGSLLLTGSARRVLRRTRAGFKRWAQNQALQRAERRTGLFQGQATGL